MAYCPFAFQRPVENHGGPIGHILGVVEHVTVGESSPYPEFANPANEVSSHFGILNDGTIEQYVNTNSESWAQVEGNSSYLSVETVGEPDEPMTEAQVQSFGKLMAWIHMAHGVELVITDTPGEPGLIGHGDGGVAWGNHIGCPGDLRKSQRAQILQLAGGSAPRPIPPVPAPPAPAQGGFVPPTLSLNVANPSSVRSLQTLLNMHNAGLAVDGDFGPETEEALKLYQGVMGLAQDGVAGPLTWTALCSFG